MSSDLQEYANHLAGSARHASGILAAAAATARSAVLHRFAELIRQAYKTILDANAIDVESAIASGLDRALIERLKLDPNRLGSMADGIRQIADQSDPVGQVIERRVRPDGLRIEKRRAAIGVILFCYESRPNVTADAAALCVKSGNAVILRGGKEAMHSNSAIAGLMVQALNETNLPPAVVQLVDTSDRRLLPLLLKLNQHIDLVIPRGGESLIRAVMTDSAIPVLKHFTGNCHVYVDASALSMEESVRQICVNAKTSYPGGAVCNAVEHILFHYQAQSLVAKVCSDLAAQGVEIRGDDRTRVLYPAAKPTTVQDWSTEYLSLIVGIKIVDSLNDAIDHINTYGSHHTDAILSSSPEAIEQFVARVDSASVLVNASTRLADGGEYGLGAEVGISTDKLHARGPMGVSDLTTYKWVVSGHGHLRS